MRRPVKVKSLSTRVPLRKAATTASPAARRSFPAWIVADESGVPFVAKAAAVPRVRDGLVLRTVAKKKISSAKGAHDATGAR